jgi:hypothetical protein
MRREPSKSIGGKQGLEEGVTAPSQGESATRMTTEKAEFEFEIVDGVIDT